MNFLILLICIGINRYWIGKHPLHSQEWFERLLINFERSHWYHSKAEVTRLILGIGGLVLVLQLLLWVTGDLLFGIPRFVLSLAILGYAMDISPLEKFVETQGQYLRRMSDEDDPGAYLARRVREQVYAEFSSIYPVIFWFLVLGPVPALLYRLLIQYAPHGQADRAARDRILHLLEWLPVRITGWGFALLGNFATSSGHLIDVMLDFGRSSSDVLADLLARAVPASNADSLLETAVTTLREYADLLQRTLYFWIAIIAIAILLGWH